METWLRGSFNTLEAYHDYTAVLPTRVLNLSVSQNQPGAVRLMDFSDLAQPPKGRR